MSTLIDQIRKVDDWEKCEVNGFLYCAKPLNYTTFFTFGRRIKDAWRVLTGKSFAVHFKKDEPK